jgi:hypothetical protein
MNLPHFYCWKIEVTLGQSRPTIAADHHALSVQNHQLHDVVDFRLSPLHLETVPLPRSLAPRSGLRAHPLFGLPHPILAVPFRPLVRPGHYPSPNDFPSPCLGAVLLPHLLDWGFRISQWGKCLVWHE